MAHAPVNLFNTTSFSYRNHSEDGLYLQMGSKSDEFVVDDVNDYDVVKLDAVVK